MSAMLAMSWKVEAEISRVRRPHFRAKIPNNSEVKSLTWFGQLVGVRGGGRLGSLDFFPHAFLSSLFFRQ